MAHYFILSILVLFVKFSHSIEQNQMPELVDGEPTPHPTSPPIALQMQPALCFFSQSGFIETSTAEHSRLFESVPVEWYNANNEMTIDLLFTITFNSSAPEPELFVQFSTCQNGPTWMVVMRYNSVHDQVWLRIVYHSDTADSWKLFRQVAFEESGLTVHDGEEHLLSIVLSKPAVNELVFDVSVDQTSIIQFTNVYGNTQPIDWYLGAITDGRSMAIMDQGYSRTIILGTTFAAVSITSLEISGEPRSTDRFLECTETVTGKGQLPQLTDAADSCTITTTSTETEKPSTTETDGETSTTETTEQNEEDEEDPDVYEVLLHIELDANADDSDDIVAILSDLVAEYNQDESCEVTTEHTVTEKPDDSGIVLNVTLIFCDQAAAQETLLAANEVDGELQRDLMTELKQNDINVEDIAIGGSALNFEAAASPSEEAAEPDSSAFNMTLYFAGGAAVALCCLCFVAALYMFRRAQKKTYQETMDNMQTPSAAAASPTPDAFGVHASAGKTPVINTGGASPGQIEKDEALNALPMSTAAGPTATAAVVDKRALEGNSDQHEGAAVTGYNINGADQADAASGELEEADAERDRVTSLQSVASVESDYQVDMTGVVTPNGMEQHGQMEHDQDVNDVDDVVVAPQTAGNHAGILDEANLQNDEFVVEGDDDENRWEYYYEEDGAQRTGQETGQTQGE